MQRNRHQQLFIAAALLIAICAAAYPLLPQAEDLAAEEKEYVVERISEMLVERYVFPDIAKKNAEALQELHRLDVDG